MPRRRAARRRRAAARLRLRLSSPTDDKAPPPPPAWKQKVTLAQLLSMQTLVVKALFVLGGGACAAASAAASPMTAAITSDGELSCWNGGFPFAVPGGSGARAAPPSGAGHGNRLYMVHAGFLDTTNLQGGAAAAAAAGGSPGSHPNSDLCCGLLWGSGGENKRFGTPAQHFPSPDIPIRYGQCTAPLAAAAAAAIPTHVPLVPRLHDSCFHAYAGCRQNMRLINFSCAVAAQLGAGAASRPRSTTS